MEQHSSAGPLLLTGQINTPKWIFRSLGIKEHSWKQETCRIVIEAIILKRKILLDERLGEQQKCKRRAVAESKQR